MPGTRTAAFLDRSSEREALDRLLADVRAGRSATLVLRGEAGIGKTALLRYAARNASGFRVAEIEGVEAEMELPFAGLHQLCAPMLGARVCKPVRRRTVCGTARYAVGRQRRSRWEIELAPAVAIAHGE